MKPRRNLRHLAATLGLIFSIICVLPVAAQFQPIDFSVLTVSNLAEGGTGTDGTHPNSRTYTMVLNAQPTANVTVAISSEDDTQITVSPASIIFTPGNWNQPQIATVTVVDNQVDHGSRPYIFISHALSGGGFQHTYGLQAQYNDNDTAGVTVTETGGSTATTEAGGTDTFTVVLDTEPLEDVSIAVSSSDTSEGMVDKSSLVFTASNWSTAQTVTVTGQDDNLVDGDQPYDIVLAAAVSTDSHYNGIDPADVSVTNTDDDTGVMLSTSAVTVTEATGPRHTATYTVKLSTQPSGTVTIAITGGDTSIATVSPASLTFTTSNWNTAQQVTVTGQNEDIDHGVSKSVSIYHTPSGRGYGDRDTVLLSVTVLDDDNAGITVTETSGSTATTEAGGADTISVVLDTEPTANVTIAVSSSDTTEGTVDKGSLVFIASNWSTPQIVTVTGQDDNLADGDQNYTIVLARAVSGDVHYGGSLTRYNAINPADVTVTNTDDDAGVMLSTSAVTVTEASGSSNTANYTVKLSIQPSGNVTVTPTSSDTSVATVSPASLIFTTSNWNTVQTVTVTGVDDSSDGDRSTTITHTVTGADYASVSAASVVVTLTDDDNSPPTGSVTITGTPTQGQTLTAVTSTIVDPDGPASLTFTYQWKRDSTAISSATGNTYVLTQADVGKAITVTVSWTDDGGTAESLTSAVAVFPSVVTVPAAPAGLKVIARSGKVKFRWTIPNDLSITHYEYKQWTGNTEPAGGWVDFTGTMSATTRSRSVRSLTDGTEYNFRIRAVAAGNITGAPSDVITVTPAITPDVPGKPTVTAVAGDGQVTLSWDNPNNAAITRYQIRQQVAPEDWGSWADIPGSDKDTTSYTVTGLTNDIWHHFRIRAMASGVVGVKSSSVSARPVASTPVASPPSKPTGFAAVAGDGQVTLSWNNPNNADITRYQYEYWTGAPESGSWMDVSGSDANTTSHVVSSLTNDSQYHFRIRAMAGGVAGVKSSFVSATPVVSSVPMKPPGQPRVLVARAGGDGEVRLSWKNPHDGSITGYQYKQWQGGNPENYQKSRIRGVPEPAGGWMALTTSPDADTITATLTRLDNGVFYSFRIRALVDTVAGRASEIVRVRVRTPLEVTVGDGQVTLNWSNPNNPAITGYQIKQWTDRLEYGFWEELTGSDANTTSYVISGLDNGVVYGFRIRAMAGGKSVLQFDKVRAMPTGAGPGKPQRFGLHGKSGDRQVTLIWRKPKPAEYTTIRRYELKTWSSEAEPTGGWANIGKPSTSLISGKMMYRKTGLVNGANYSFRIRAVGNNGVVGPPSDIVTATPASLTARVSRSVTMGGITIIGADPGSLGVDGDKINARITGTPIQLELPSDHRVTRAAFSRPTPEQLPPPQAGVSFGAAAAYVDVDIDTPLPTSSKATVCLQRPDGMPDHAAVYHLADQDSEWEQLTGTGNQPGYICGRTQSFSPVVVGTRVLGFTAASIDDHIWTLGAALGELQLPEATNGDSTITYRLHPRLPAGVNFDAATRRIHGTPTQVHDTTAYTYTATDTDGDTATLQFNITVEAAALQQRARALDVVLSALGRTAATDAVDIISNRFTATAAARPEVTLGGTALTSAFDADAVARVKDTLTATDRQHWYARDTKPQLLRSAKQLLTQSNFAIPLTTADGDTAADWTLWGRAAASGFSSNRLDTDGELYSGYIGLERRFGKQHNALAGIAITHSDGDADYRVTGNFLRTDGSRGAIEGEVDLEMTSILPYIHYTPRAGTGIWGMAGIGRGEVELRDEVGKVETDVDLLMAAVGGRQLLSRWHGIDFALKSDAFAVQLKSDRKLRLAEVTGVARRARVALEMSSERQLSTDAVLRPSIEFGGRWDDGDADTGVGAEIGGGLEYRASGFSVAARGRYSFAHRQSGFEDWGGSLSLTVGEAGMQGHGQGLWLSFTPEWGNPTSGVQQTWNGISVAGVEDAVSATDTAAAGRLKLEFGYGMQTRGRGWQVMPYGGLSATDEDTRYRLGGHILANESMDLRLEGERRETADGDTEHGIFLSWKLQL